MQKDEIKSSGLWRATSASVVKWDIIIVRNLQLHWIELYRFVSLLNRIAPRSSTLDEGCALTVHSAGQGKVLTATNLLLLFYLYLYIYIYWYLNVYLFIYYHSPYAPFIKIVQFVQHSAVKQNQLFCQSTAAQTAKLQRISNSPCDCSLNSRLIAI